MTRARWLALAATALLACSNGRSAVTSTPAPATATAPAAIAPARGEVVRATFRSEALGVDKQVVVYLPAGYAAQPERRWPVFYYLHGLGGDETNWTGGGKLDAAADAMGLAAIVVMPDGDDGFYVDSTKPVDLAGCLARGDGLFFPERDRATTCVAASKYDTYIARDLVRWVDATYRTDARRAGRGIAGLSMGGFGALQLALRHPDLFAAAASHSGVVSLLYAGPMPYQAGAPVTLVTTIEQRIRTLGPLGPWLGGLFGKDLATWRAHDPGILLEQLAPGTLALYLDCGTEDGFGLQHAMQYLHDRLAARGIAHAYYLGPGKHDMAFWSARVPHSLAFLRDSLAAAAR